MPCLGLWVFFHKTGVTQIRSSFKERMKKMRKNLESPKSGGINRSVLSDRKKWKIIFSILIMIGYGMFWWWMEREPLDDASPRLLEEKRFKEIVPYHYQDNRFYFWGDTGYRKGYYVFDLEQGRLFRRNWSRKYSNTQEVHDLGFGQRVWVFSSSKNRFLLLVDHLGKQILLANHLLPGKQPLSVSPRKDAFVFAEKKGKEISIKLYRLQQRKMMTVMKGTFQKQFEKRQWVQWSSKGGFFLVDGRHVYRTKDGKKVRTLPGQEGAWSNAGTDLAYITRGNRPSQETSLLGNKVVIWNAETGDEQVIYESEPEKWILRRISWDPDGRYLAFPVGQKENGGLQFQEVHVTDGKLFHYVEKEQNLLPYRLENVLLSKGGNYLSYSANGILKLINLKTQESQVYDVYTQEQQDQTEYIRYDPQGVWLSQTHEILFVARNMEEKRVYWTDYRVKGFYLSSHRDRILVMEEEKKGHKLRLIQLGKDGRPHLPSDN